MSLLSMKKISAISVGGSVAIIVFVLCASASAIVYNGQYRPWSNYISDLGNPIKNPSGHLIFDAGCILSGLALALAVYGFSLWKTSDAWQNKQIRIAQYCGYIMAFSIAMVGVFSQDQHMLHVFWAGLFFILLMVFMLLIHFALRSHRQYMKWIQYYIIALIIIDVIYLLTYVLKIQAPILEWLAVVGGLLWIGLVGYNTFKIGID